MALADRVPLAEISERARDMQPGVTAQKALTGIVFGIAWLTGRGLRLLWLAFTLPATAAMLGWQRGTDRPARIPRADLENEVARLRSEVQRLSGG